MYYALPMLYLNLGGEMLYILQQRLHAQKICPEKTIKVMNEVIGTFLDSKQIHIIFNDKSSLKNLYSIRKILEKVILSSIMKLDTNSMTKLFELIIMMVKYQLDTATGPREIILLTLNHMDAVRELAVDKTLNVYVDLVHRLILDIFGNMKHEEIWQIRNACLQELKNYTIRVSILLRLGVQNEDATFNRLTQRYNERYRERKQILQNIKLLDDDSSTGSLSLFGDRVTLLGKNLYLYTFGHSKNSSFTQNLHQMLTKSSIALKQELEILSTQLGTEETISSVSLNLQLLTHNDRKIESNFDNLELYKPDKKNVTSEENNFNDKNQLIYEYKNNLVYNVVSDFSDVDESSKEPMDIMNLLNIL